MTTKHIGYSNPRNFKEKIELLKMKEAASTANFAAAMRDAQEICKIAHAYDALPLSLDHSQLHNNILDCSGIIKTHSLSNINSTDYHVVTTPENSNQDTSVLQKSMLADRKDVYGSSVSSPHASVYPLGPTIHDERGTQRLLPSSVPIKETVPTKSNEESKSQTPNVCPFLYDPVGSSTDTSHLHERNTFLHDTDYGSSSSTYSSSWSFIPPTQHSASKSCLENWNNICSDVSQHQIQKNFNLPHYSSLQPKSHLPANPYMFSASHSNSKIASTSLLTQQSSLTNSSQYTCESGYFSVGVGTPVGFRSFPPTNSLQHHSKMPFSANITEQISRVQTPYSVVDWRRTASDSSIHHTLSDIQLNPIEQYAYGTKTDKSHILSPRSIMSSDQYFRPACKLRGVEEETPNILPPMDETDNKRGCIVRHHRDSHLLDKSHFIHTELPTNEPHIMPPKRPYTCSSESQSSNGFDTVNCNMKMCTPHIDNMSGGMDKKNFECTSTSLKHDKSWKIRSTAYNPHCLEQTYPCMSSNNTTTTTTTNNNNNNTVSTDSTKYSEFTDPSSSAQSCLNQDNYPTSGNQYNLPSHRSNLANMLVAKERGGVVGARSGAGGGTRDNTTTDDLFLRNSNDLDEYLQLPNLICKADESNNHFAGRRDSCTMTAEILSNLSSFREEMGENCDGKLHSDPTTVPHCSMPLNRCGVYAPNIPVDDATNNMKNIVKHKTVHLHNSMMTSSDSMSANTTNNSNSFTMDRCRLQNAHFNQSMNTSVSCNGGDLTMHSSSTVYSSCLHHVGDKIGISMSPNDYRLLTDPRLVNYVTDKETEAKIINQ
ncbi:hypothetical protein MN116_008519 [Schistosoma mekongi]|uniref:TORC_N domain-containing protein n=1 Tax=Schistosoma mekongi TaxID=38744 RepID=A0AAE1Z6B1_SCHME|nr:hypothetical protein MN116_008519 [Schistosoma mekongi]